MTTQRPMERKEFVEARAAVTAVAARIAGDPTTADEWHLIARQLREAARAADKAAKACE